MTPKDKARHNSTSLTAVEGKGGRETTTTSSSSAEPGGTALYDAINRDGYMTILGFGSLLSEKSSRLTFPDLKNFRLARVPNYKRVFGHPTGLFFRRGIANMETLEMSSLCVEYEKDYPGIIAAAFEVSTENMMEDGVPSQEFLEREEEFNIIQVPYINFECDRKSTAETKFSVGVICTRSTDEAFLKRWGEERFNEHFRKYGIETIWGWTPDSGLRPCAIYMRHCYLAAKSLGEACFNSFLDDTYLVDRITTIRQYVQQYPEVLDVRPPAELVNRYSG